MLPIPFEDYVPQLLRENIDNKGQAFVDKVTSITEDIRDETLEVYYINKVVERVPETFLDELGYFLNAGLKNTDSDMTKRNKIVNAIQGHKNRGTWEGDAKPKIDAITGYSARIFKETTANSDDSIEMGQTSDEDPTFYWSTEQGNDGSDSLLGTWEVGDFTEYVIAGNIYIDCHQGITTAVLTSDQIDQIVNELEFDIAPAYMIIYLGYVDATGTFIIYSGGIIS